MAQFKSGDVVRVKPVKGPWMIVESCEGNNAVCFWFDKIDVCQRETFAVALLEVRKSETGSITGFAGSRRSEDV